MNPISKFSRKDKSSGRNNARKQREKMSRSVIMMEEPMRINTGTSGDDLERTKTSIIDK